MTVQCYRDLVVWQKAMQLATDCYLMTRQFPKEELFGLTSQIRRAATAVPANVAEGHASGYTRIYLRHIGVARGSLAELETHVLLANNVGLLDGTLLDSRLTQTREIGRMLVALGQALSRRD